MLAPVRSVSPSVHTGCVSALLRPGCTPGAGAAERTRRAFLSEASTWRQQPGFHSGVGTALGAAGTGVLGVSDPEAQRMQLGQPQARLHPKPVPSCVLPGPPSLSTPSRGWSVGLGGHHLPRNPLPGCLKSKDILFENLLC